MRHSFSRPLGVLLATVVASVTPGCLGFSQVQAAPQSEPVPVDAGAIMVEQAWARASPGNATSGAAYVTLIGAHQADALVGLSTEIAAVSEVHESFVDNSVMKMRAVPRLPVPAGRTVMLAPGGYHVMMMGLKHPLVAGQSFPLTLRFEHAPPVTVTVLVRAIGQDAPAADHGSMKMN